MKPFSARSTASLLLLLGSSAFAAGPGQDPGEEPRAVRVSVLGGIMGFDAAAYRAVRTALGTLIADGVLDRFEMYSVGLEGGGRMCVELGRSPALAVELIEQALAGIQPDPATTEYSLVRVASCGLE